MVHRRQQTPFRILLSPASCARQVAAPAADEVVTDHDVPADVNVVTRNASVPLRNANSGNVSVVGNSGKKLEELLDEQEQKAAAEQEVQRRARAARHGAEVCSACQRRLAPTDPVWIRRVWSGHSWWKSPQCEGCVPRATRQWYRRMSCLLCTRIVYQDSRRCSRTARTFCSRRCRWRYWNAQRNARAAAERQTRRCPGCEQLFTPKRRDARTCSAACRQRKWRVRSRCPVPARKTRVDLS